MEIPLFPLHTVLCPGIVLPLHIFEERYRALTRHCLDDGRAVRRRPDPRGPRGRARPDALARRRRGAGRDPRGGPLSGRPLRPARRGDRPVRHRHGRPGPRAVPGRRRHAARGRGRRRGPGRTPGRLRHPPVRPLPRADAGARRRDDRGPRHPGRGRARAVRADDADRGGPTTTTTITDRRSSMAAIEDDDVDGAARSDRVESVDDRAVRAERRRDLVIPDDPTVLSLSPVGDRPDRAAAPPGTARGARRRSSGSRP